MKMKQWLPFTLITMLTACSSTDLQDYTDSTPTLTLRDFFDGTLQVTGLLKARSGKVTRRFTATIDASWEGEHGTLDEIFYFNDGETQTRVWKLTQFPDGRIQGTAGDVIGVASGAGEGFAFNWRYTLEIPYKDSSIKVNMDDWMYLINERQLINTTTLRKFGFKVGELIIMIEKVEPV